MLEHFQASATPLRGQLVKSLRDTPMISISTKTALGKATSLPGGRFRPISSSLGCHDRVINGS